MTTFFEKCLSPKVLLWSSFALTVVSTVLSMVYLEDVYRDVGNVYATCTRQFAEGHFLEALNPALPVLQIFIAGTISFITGLEPLKSLILTCGIFFAGMIPPLYVFLKRFLSPRLAAWGVLLTVFAPKVLRISISGMPESARNFFLILLLCLIFSLFDKPKFYKTVLIGLTLVGLTLSRSEGILISITLFPFLFLFLLWIYWKENWKFKLWQAFRYTFLTAVFFLLFLLPRVYQNYLVTGYPTPDARLDRYIHQYITPSKPLRDLSDNEKTYVNISVTRTTEKKSFFGQFYSVLQQSARGGYEIYLSLAGIGLLTLIFAFAVRRYLFADWFPEAQLTTYRIEYLFILLIYILHSVIYFPLDIAYRYYVFLVPLLMPLTMTGIYFIWRLLSLFRLQIPTIIGIVILLFMQVVNGLDIIITQNTDHKKSAEWIKSHFKKGKDLQVLNYHSYVLYWIDGKVVNPFYEGPRTLPQCASKFDIAIVEPDDKRVLDIFRSRKDVEEVTHPYVRSIIIFRKLPNE